VCTLCCGPCGRTVGGSKHQGMETYICRLIFCILYLHIAPRHIAATPSSALWSKQVDEEGLAALVSLLRLSAAVQKGQLHKLFANLAWHPATRKALLRLLMSLLRMPLSADEAEGAQPAKTSRPSTGPAPGASLAAALEARLSFWLSCTKIGLTGQ
jgi:hypothetical protein